MRREAQFVICVANKGYAASLELRKIYQLVPDKVASTLHQIRVIDESGEIRVGFHEIPYAGPRARPLAVTARERNNPADTDTPSLRSLQGQVAMLPMGFVSSPYGVSAVPTVLGSIFFRPLTRR